MLMNKWVAGALFFGFLFLVLLSVLFGNKIRAVDFNLIPPQITGTSSVQTPTAGPVNTGSAEKEYPKLSVVAQNLEVPWGIAFLPDKSILFTERPGRVRLISGDGSLR